jgi:hypothetical protein
MLLKLSPCGGTADPEFRSHASLKMDKPLVNNDNKIVIVTMIKCNHNYDIISITTCQCLKC